MENILQSERNTSQMGRANIFLNSVCSHPPSICQKFSKVKSLVFRRRSGERTAQTQIGLSRKENKKLAKAQRQYLKIHPNSCMGFLSKGGASKWLSDTKNPSISVVLVPIK